MPAFTYVEDLNQQVKIPQNGTQSQTLYQNDQLKVVATALSAGQRLEALVETVPAMIEIVHGQTRLDLDGDIKEAGPGAFLALETKLPLTIYAKTDLVLLVTTLTINAAE